ncbi:MAG: acyltransferase [Bacteroidales bacterium]|nr:acyltransferase [Bacteroidales bacterium]
MSGRNYSIDILKFFCACLIVFIHTIDWQFYQEFLPLTRCAVPCFFIISGYLLFDKEQGRIIPERLKRNIIHIGKILLWTTLFYLVFDEIVYYFSNGGHLWMPSVKRLIKMFVLNVPLFGHHLWYLFAYLYVLFIVFFVNKYDKWKLLFIIAPLLLVPHLVLLLSGKDISIFLVRNFLFLGLPYFAIGAMIKAKVNNNGKQKRYKLLLLLGIVLFSITSLLERDLLLSLGKIAVREHYISTFFLTISLFLFFLSYERDQRTWLSEIGEKDSLYIYIFHPVFIYSFRTIFNHINLFEFYSYVAPIVVIIFTIVFVKCLRSLRIIG